MNAILSFKDWTNGEGLGLTNGPRCVHVRGAFLAGYRIGTSSHRAEIAAIMAAGAVEGVIQDISPVEPERIAAGAVLLADALIAELVKEVGP